MRQDAAGRGVGQPAQHLGLDPRRVLGEGAHESALDQDGPVDIGGGGVWHHHRLQRKRQAPVDCRGVADEILEPGKGADGLLDAFGEGPELVVEVDDFLGGRLGPQREVGDDADAVGSSSQGLFDVLNTKLEVVPHKRQLNRDISATHPKEVGIRVCTCAGLGAVC